MFLSKVRLPQNLQRNPYELHRQLWRLFPHRPDAQRDFLFRVEDMQSDQGLIVLLQSAQTPKPDGDGLLASKPFEPVLPVGSRLRFRLRANPVRTIRDEEQKRPHPQSQQADELKRCRVPLTKEDEQRGWLERKFVNTARIESVLIQKEAPLYFRKNQRGTESNGMTGKIQPVLFDGLLIIDHEQDFMKLLRNGIGPAKAFGCGLLSIAPA
jgi:CRISPR system Cascade subunit CasE